jgi:hypothetical protein
LTERAVITISLAGPLRVVNCEGRDCTPRARKAQAILALLAVAPRFRRNRSWVQDKLWSQSPAEPGAAAFRQTLSVLRRALGEARDALIAEAGFLALDPVRCRVIDTPERSDREPHGAAPEFVAGLDVEDPEFEDWLREHRAYFAARWSREEVGAASPARVSAPPGPPVATLIVARTEADSPDSRLVGDMLAARIATRAARVGGASLRIGSNGLQAAEPGRTLVLRLRLARSGPDATVQAMLVDARRDDPVWFVTRQLDPAEALAPPEAFVASAADAVAREFANAPPDATDAERAVATLHRALTARHGFSQDGLLRVDGALQEALAARPSAALTARRALVNMWRLIERHCADPAATLEETRALSAQALERDPQSAEGLAAAAEIADIDRNPALALDLARRAVTADPMEPLAHAAFAKALARNGSPDKAYEAAIRARSLAGGRADQSWWAMLCCIAALRCNRGRDAIRFAEIAHSLDGSFRPPLRFLTALRFAAGDAEGAAAAAVNLRALEPDFTPEIMAEPDYPLRSLDYQLLQTVARARLL